MSISFNRNRVQLEYERILGITSAEDLAEQKDSFKNHVLTVSESNSLKSVARLDALDFFNNGIISFVEGIDSIYLGRYSWATVKLYYSVYYLIRASMTANNYVLLRNQSMFRLKLKDGEKPYTTRNKRYNSTHGGTLSHYKDIFNGSDILLTNKIDTKDVYEWIEDAREVVNYRDVSFREPDCLNIWDKFHNCVDEEELSSLLNILQNDTNYIYCFQEEYAIVAIPIKRLQLTIADMFCRGLLQAHESNRSLYYNRILRGAERGLEVLSELTQQVT